MFKISVFIPEEHADALKRAMFNAGAGRIGNYECCSFETLGIGQFKPLKGANPFIGKPEQIEKVKELKVEMVCEDEYIRAVVEAMKKNHPYEMPAYDIIKLVEF